MTPSPLRFESPPRLSFWGRRSRPWQTGLGLVMLCALVVSLFTLLAQMRQGHLTSQALAQQAQNLLSLSRLTPKPSKTQPSGFAPGAAVGRRFTATEASELSQDQRRQLDRVVQQLNTPWQDLFQQLERSTPKEVALISIEPDAGRASVKLQAEARTLDVLLSYAASLESRDVLGALTYGKHETNEQDPNKPVRLSFEMNLLRPARLMPFPVEARPAPPAARASSTPSGAKP